MKNKIKIILLAIVIFINILLIKTINAGYCHPSYKWNWTVTSSCTWPDGYKVYWNIYVWNHTITMWSYSDMWINLSSNKITFWNWKINLASTAKISNHVSSRYYISVNYNTNWNWVDCQYDAPWNQCTHCPSWMYVFNRSSYSAPASNWTSSYMWIIPRPMPPSWRFYCWTKWS